jgi:hypothetical protein
VQNKRRKRLKLKDTERLTMRSTYVRSRPSLALEVLLRQHGSYAAVRHHCLHRLETVYATGRRWIYEQVLILIDKDRAGRP